MAFQFPAAPIIGQVYTSGGVSFRWNGTAWYLIGGANAPLSQEAGDLRYVQIANARSMESRIINGNFAIDQRNAGSFVTVNSSAPTYPVDRWFGLATGGGAFGPQRVSNGSSFQLGMTVLTADASLAAGDFYVLTHRIEGINIADMQFGTAGASAFTFACRLGSSVAGTYPIVFRNNANTMSYVKTVTLPAGGFVLVTMTIPGPTSGVWESGNSTGLIIQIGLGSGSTYTAPATDSWQSGLFLTAAGCVNWMATNGNSMQVQDARLYPGSIDYGPCQRLYADELRLCQRYFEKSYDIGTVPGAVSAVLGSHIVRMSGTQSEYVTINYGVTKRAPAQLTFYDQSTGAVGTWFDFSDSSHPAVTVFASRTGDNGFTAEVPGSRAEHGISGHWTASAEL